MMTGRIDGKQVGNGSNHSRSIMYQSRMRILKSRESARNGRRSKRGEKIMCENSFSSSFVDRGTRKPCSGEKLIPPMQLMTKRQTFRHLYLKYHPPKIQVRVDFLEKKEDPILVKKREKIFARIRASEMASERLKREKERAAGHRRSMLHDGGALVNSISDHSVNDESQQDVNTSDPSTGQKDGALFTEDSSVVVSGFVTDLSKKHDGSRVISSTSNNDDVNDEESFGDCFAFLSDWKKEKKIR